MSLLCDTFSCTIVYANTHRASHVRCALVCVCGCVCVQEHYVARGAFGPVVLTMTILATSFSGFTVVGVPADAYANGFLVLRWIGGIQVCVSK